MERGRKCKTVRKNSSEQVIFCNQQFRGLFIYSFGFFIQMAGNLQIFVYLFSSCTVKYSNECCRRQCDEVKEELSENLNEQEKLRRDLEEDRELIVRLAKNVEEAQRTVNTLLEQKVSILDDVDRLKGEFLWVFQISDIVVQKRINLPVQCFVIFGLEAIEAQDEYISALEEDIVIYEEHIGVLRDSLGASKIENRAYIKSKAFETKLRALEQEKEQITKRNNGQSLF